MKNLKPNSHIFFQENACQNVACKMAAIFPQTQCVNILIFIELCISSHFVVFFFLWLGMTNFTRIIQDYFTGIGAII